MSALELRYKPPGPVGAGFLQSDAFVRAIMGPIGSGKTSVCMVDPVYRALRQAPSPIDGVRRYRFVAVRDTYPNLWSTTIPSWQQWFPPTMGKWNASSPPSHEIDFEVQGLGRVNFQAEFLAIGEHRVEDVLRGKEATQFYLNEMDLLPPEVLDYCTGRVGRYPGAVHGGPTWYGVTGDLNAPDDENYVYKKFLEELPEGWRFFRQPSGLAPNAENLSNLPDGYYQRQMAGKAKWYIRRFIENRFGQSREGKPVYEDFADDLHVASERLQAIKGLPITVGMDAGRKPAAVFLQEMPSGQIRIVHEITETDMGAKRFGGTINKALAEHFKGFEFKVFSDPASHVAGDQDEKTWSQIVGHEIKARVRAAPVPTNDLEIRLEAVRTQLQKVIEGQPMLLVSPSCKKIRKGFNSGYRFKRVKVAGEVYEDKPEKNEFSHPHDALQYAVLGLGLHVELTGRKRRTENRARPATAEMD
ncbi:MAG TPA: hypothetical protein VEC14_02390 [Reyranellaceae bacterium]|nr:hypothetical protein [Reyranellaceae bacterium]